MKWSAKIRNKRCSTAINNIANRKGLDGEAKKAIRASIRAVAEATGRDPYINVDANSDDIVVEEVV